jgi:hypothetical protein
LSTTAAATGNVSTKTMFPQEIAGRSVESRITVATTRPVGPNVVALFSHRDRCGIWPLVGIGEPTKSP